METALVILCVVQYVVIAKLGGSVWATILTTFAILMVLAAMGNNNLRRR